MGNKPAKSKGNTARRASQRNNGLPAGVKRGSATSNYLASATNTLFRAAKLSEFARRVKLLRRWGVNRIDP